MASTNGNRLLVAAGLFVVLGGVIWWLTHKGGDPKNGKARAFTPEQLYRSYCAGCHGDTGRGDGPAAGRYVPPPTDFVQGPWKRGNSAEAIRRSIVDGVPPAMPPMQSLTSEELDALVKHVLELMGQNTHTSLSQPARSRRFDDGRIIR